MMKYLVPVFLLGLLITVVSLIGYQGASTPFFLDDVDEMTYIHGLDSLAFCFGGDCYGLFRPIKNLIFYSVSTFMSESAQAGHALSFAFYLTTTAMVFWWFKRWFGSRVWAAVAVTIWALAPTQVNNLTWLSSANILVDEVRTKEMQTPESGIWLAPIDRHADGVGQPAGYRHRFYIRWCRASRRRGREPEINDRP